MKNLLYIWKNRLQKFTDYPMAIFPFLKKRLFYVFIADRYIRFYDKGQFLSYEETLNKAIKENKSIIRFGDELFDMLQGIGLYFNDWRQKYDPSLAEALRGILLSTNPKVLLSFNPELIFDSREDFKNKGIENQWQFWINSKIFLKDYLQKGRLYGSALCFNPRYNEHIPYNQLKEYFSTKNIIIVASNADRFKHISLGVTTGLVDAPQSDAWQKYDEIYEQTFNCINRIKGSKEEILILASISTAGKVLVQQLSEKGYTAWDTGQFFDLAFEEIQKLGIKK